jgi:hypothetical protein
MQRSIWSNFLESFILLNFVIFICFELNFNFKLSSFQFILSLYLKCCKSSARALITQIVLVLLEYCSFSKVALQYQYQGFSIVLQYKTARLVHPWLLTYIKHNLSGTFCLNRILPILTWYYSLTKIYIFLCWFCSIWKLSQNEGKVSNCLKW